MTVDVDDIEIDIEFLSREQLMGCVKEAEKRGLIKKKPDLDRLRDAYGLLMGRRKGKAVEEFYEAVFDSYFLDCHRALMARQWDAAVCALDKIFEEKSWA